MVLLAAASTSFGSCAQFADQCQRTPCTPSSTPSSQVVSTIDYCNAVLYGATDAVIWWLQAMLHAAVWLITGVRRNDHITPTLRDTRHWLPVSQRITFKIALMTYDCIHGRSPVYFRDICSPIVSVPFRSRLRCADNDDMIVPRTRTARYGPCSFRIAAPQIWNMLPRTVVLVANSSSRALRLGSLCKPTHKRRLWELCLSGALQILDLIDWLIEYCKLNYFASDWQLQ